MLPRPFISIDVDARTEPLIETKFARGRGDRVETVIVGAVEDSDTP
jgi:hypothetical protein